VIVSGRWVKDRPNAGTQACDSSKHREATSRAGPSSLADTPAEYHLLLGQLISRARSSLLAGFDTQLEPFGITGAQFAVLKTVADGLADSAAELCRTMHYDTGSMTRMLDRLEERNVLRRVRCTEDRRIVYLRVTDVGNALLPELRAAAAKAISRHLAGFAPEEACSFKRLLERMIQNGASTRQ